MKNYFMEMIQTSGATPENGVNYEEKTTQIGGADHCPTFKAVVGYAHVEAEAISGSKKEALKQAWKNLKEIY